VGAVEERVRVSLFSEEWVWKILSVSPDPGVFWEVASNLACWFLLTAGGPCGWCGRSWEPL
jgi:hypothetical protein